MQWADGSEIRDQYSTSERDLHMKRTIGLDSRLLHRPMTGIANYTFHIIRCLLEADPSLRYRGFGNLRWREIDLSSLQKVSPGSRRDGGLIAAKSAWRYRSSGITSASIRVATYLSKIRSARLLYRAMARRGFAMSVGSQQLDLFHAFNFRPLSDPGVPVLPVVYDLSTFRYPGFHPPDRVRWLENLGGTIGRAAMVQTISQFSKREIASIFGFPPEKIFVAPPAAAPAFAPMGFEATEPDLAAFDLKHGGFFLAVGTLEPRKNIGTLIAAYARLSPSERSRFPLVVAGGSGWGDLNLPTQAEAFRSDGTLRFLEGVPNPQLRSLYEGARLLLMPSIYEGFGMPVVEAFACGTPVAHSAGTAMDEISDGLAKTVPALDIDGWTELLRQAMEGSDHVDPVLRERRIAAARRFDWQQSGVHVGDAYRRLMA